MTAPRNDEPDRSRPWYREPWPWVLIALPLSAVIASLVTLWIALSNPDHLAVDPEEYDRIINEMRLDAEDDDSG